MDVADGDVLSRRGSSTPPATAGNLAETRSDSPIDLTRPRTLIALVF